MRLSFNLWEQKATLLPFFVAVALIIVIWLFAISVISNNEFMLVAKLPEHAETLSPALRDTNRLLVIAVSLSGIIFIACFLWLIAVVDKMVGPMRRLMKEVNERNVDSFLASLHVRKKDKLYQLVDVLKKKLAIQPYEKPDA